MAWQLTYRSSQQVPVEIEGVTPDALSGKSVAEVEQLAVWVGNRELPLGELFDVQGDASGDRIDLYGDLSGVHWIGAKQRLGEIHVHGAAGRHVGSEMTGGKIEVHGDASDWLGAELHGGTIHVHGHAGHLAGAAYRGSRVGMTGGTIMVDGDVGNEIGFAMRRGTIAVGGNAGDLIGFNILAGTILVLGSVGIRHGAGMRRGTIACLGTEQVPRLPTFRYACRYRPLALTMVLKHLNELCFEIPARLWQQEYELYNGDLIAGGKGELLVCGC